MNRNDLPQDDGLSTSGPSRYDEKVIPRILIAIGVATLALAPVSLYVLTGVAVVHRLWIAFLIANLIVWTVVFVSATGTAIAQSLTAGRRRALRWQRRVRGAARLALE